MIYWGIYQLFIALAHNQIQLNKALYDGSFWIVLHCFSHLYCEQILRKQQEPQQQWQHISPCWPVRSITGNKVKPSLVPSRLRRFRVWRRCSSLSGKFAEEAELIFPSKWWQIQNGGARPRMRLQPKFLKKWKKASEIGSDSFINVCHQMQRVVGEFSFKESFRV